MQKARENDCVLPDAVKLLFASFSPFRFYKRSHPAPLLRGSCPRRPQQRMASHEWHVNGRSPAIQQHASGT